MQRSSTRRVHTVQSSGSPPSPTVGSPEHRPAGNGAPDDRTRRTDDRRGRARPVGHRLDGCESRDGLTDGRLSSRDPRAGPGADGGAADPGDRAGHRRGGRRHTRAHLPRRRFADRARRVLPRRWVRPRQHRDHGQRRARARARIGRRRGVGRVPPGPRRPVPGRARRLRARDPLGGRTRGAVRRVTGVGRGRGRERRRQPRHRGRPATAGRRRRDPGRPGAHLPAAVREDDVPVRGRVRRSRHRARAREEVLGRVQRWARPRRRSLRRPPERGEPAGAPTRDRGAGRVRHVARRGPGVRGPSA